MPPPHQRKFIPDLPGLSTKRSHNTMLQSSCTSTASTQNTVNDEGKIIEAFNSLRDDVVKALADTSAALELKREAEEKLADATDSLKQNSATYMEEIKSLKQRLLKAEGETRTARQELASERALAKWEFENTMKASQGKNELKAAAKQLVDMPLFSGFTGSASGGPGEKFDKVREALKKIG